MEGKVKPGLVVTGIIVCVLLIIAYGLWTKDKQSTLTGERKKRMGTGVIIAIIIIIGYSVIHDKSEKAQLGVEKKSDRRRELENFFTDLLYDLIKQGIGNIIIPGSGGLKELLQTIIKTVKKAQDRWERKNKGRSNEEFDKAYDNRRHRNANGFNIVNSYEEMEELKGKIALIKEHCENKGIYFHTEIYKTEEGLYVMETF